jgi:hypothetical protein
MRPTRLLLPLMLTLAACGGGTPASTPTTPTTTASPSVDPAETARHSTCLDFARAQRPQASSSDLSKELGDAMDELANELAIDAGLYADAGDQDTSATVDDMSIDARAAAAEIRAEPDANAALTRYGEVVDELIARLGAGTCDEELG